MERETGLEPARLPQDRPLNERKWSELANPISSPKVACVSATTGRPPAFKVLDGWQS